MPITIRPARPEDVHRIETLIRAAYAIYDNLSLTLPPVADGVEEAIAETPVFLAENAGNPLGVLILRLRPPSAQIENIAVPPQAAGQGVGQALLSHAEELARQAGAHTLTLATHQALTANITYYKNRGWTETSRQGVKVIFEKPL